jgi:alkanesulfonate monooxygenase SsuD/methylene tetrahydromethanopterin reductase-like flavin-dependent oxidoreductase (luciferase family)
MHIPVCVSEDVDAVREAAQRQVGMYARFQFYRDMYRRAGYPDAGEGLSPELVDGLVTYGSEQRVAERLLELLALGMGELLVMPLTVGDDAEASRERTLAAIGRAIEQMG